MAPVQGTYTCELFEDLKGEWRWRLVNDQNGQVVGGCQEGYVKRSYCEDIATNIFFGADNVTLAVLESAVLESANEPEAARG